MICTPSKGCNFVYACNIPSAGGQLEHPSDVKSSTSTVLRVSAAKVAPQRSKRMKTQQRSMRKISSSFDAAFAGRVTGLPSHAMFLHPARSEEHTSELQ